MWKLKILLGERFPFLGTIRIEPFIFFFERKWHGGIRDFHVLFLKQHFKAITGAEYLEVSPRFLQTLGQSKMDGATLPISGKMW